MRHLHFEMIEVRQVKYSYETGKEILFPDFTVNTDDPCLLLGESGSGKTTLLHIIGGLLKSQRGTVRINGTDITSLRGASLDHFRGKHIGYIFQKNHLISALTVEKNLAMAPYLAGMAQEPSRLHDVLTQLSLDSKAKSRVSELSHGQAQRVAIARAVLNKPSIILADEPTSALDDKNCNRVIDLLLEVARKNNSALLIATHDQRLKSKIPHQITL